LLRPPVASISPLLIEYRDPCLIIRAIWWIWTKHSYWKTIIGSSGTHTDWLIVAKLSTIFRWWFMVFYGISVISWRSVLLLGENQSTHIHQMALIIKHGSLYSIKRGEILATGGLWLEQIIKVLLKIHVLTPPEIIQLCFFEPSAILERLKSHNMLIKTLILTIITFILPILF
jgi:hypothetical protein